MSNNTQKECIGCKYSPEYNDGVYHMKCHECERFYGSKYYNDMYMLDEYVLYPTIGSSSE